MFSIDLVYVILGMVIGYFLVYITNTTPKVVIKYPRLDNIETTTYVDDNGVCYKYYAKEIKCNN